MSLPRARIVSTGAAFPDRVIKNDDLRQWMDTSDEWIRIRCGIQERRVCAPGEATSDLMARAAVVALDRAGWAPESVDMILAATSTPDYLLFPSTGCLVQKKIGATGAFAFDMNAACSGFAYGLSIAQQYIRTGDAKRVLLLGGDVMSRYLDLRDRTTGIIFGDGAGAVCLEPDETGRGVHATHLVSMGEHEDLLKVEVGGSALPGPSPWAARTTEPADWASFTGEAPDPTCIRMAGREIFKHAVSSLAEVTETVLAKAGITVADVSWVVPHQANLRIVEAVRKRLGMPEEKFVINLDRYGNTSAGTIPTALDELVASGRLEAGQWLVLVAFGAGLTYGAAVVRW